MDGIRKTGAGAGAIRVEGGEGGATKLVTVVEGGGEGRELYAAGVGVGVWRGGEARGRDVWSVRIRPGRVDAGACTLGHG